MDFKAYLSSHKDKSVYFLGAGISHRELISLFAKAGAAVTVCDRVQKDAFDKKLYDEYSSLGVRFLFGDGYLSTLRDADVVFRSPGISYFKPEICDAVEAGVNITSELEEFVRLCDCLTIGVTGSDGKTTTTTLISIMLEAAGRKVWLGGNIGVPLLARLGDIASDDVAVVELSSFQLMSMKHSPQIAVITNIAENHLDYHKDMDEYISSKTNIFTHQKSTDILVLNADDVRVSAFAENAAGEVRYFSASKAVENGAYFLNNTISLSSSEHIINANELILRGRHNAVNFATASAAVMGLVPVEAMREVGLSFAGVEHRLEFVRERKGVKYYNDSIATTPTRTAAGLRSFDDKVILIAGGYDKHISFQPMVDDVMSRVKLMILTGATADIIEKLIESDSRYDGTNPRIIKVESLSEAVRFASIAAASGDEVLLSPACASFDSFKNFEARGERFKEMVNAL